MRWFEPPLLPAPDPEPDPPGKPPTFPAPASAPPCTDVEPATPRAVPPLLVAPLPAESSLLSQKPPAFGSIGAPCPLPPTMFHVPGSPAFDPPSAEPPTGAPPENPPPIPLPPEPAPPIPDEPLPTPDIAPEIPPSDPVPEPAPVPLDPSLFNQNPAALGSS